MVLPKKFSRHDAFGRVVQQRLGRAWVENDAPRGCTKHPRDVFVSVVQQHL